VRQITRATSNFVVILAGVCTKSNSQKLKEKERKFKGI
jgi:hypothetical protein